MDISITFNVFQYYFYYDDEPSYLKFGVDSRSSLLHVEGINIKHVIDIFIEYINNIMLAKKPINKIRQVKHTT